MNAATDREPWVTARVVAGHMGMSIDWVLDKYQAGLLPGRKFGRAVRFRMSEVDQAIDSGVLDPSSRGNEPPASLRSAHAR